MVVAPSYHKGTTQIPPPAKRMESDLRRTIQWHGIGAAVCGIALITNMTGTVFGWGSPVGALAAFIGAIVLLSKMAGAWTQLKELRYDVPLGSRDPPAFANMHEVADVFHRGNIPIFRPVGDEMLLKRFRRALGGRNGWGSRPAQVVSQQILTSQGTNWFLISLVFLFAGIGVVAGILSIRFEQGTWDIIWGVVGILTCIGLSVAAALTLAPWAREQWNTIAAMFPAYAPPTEAEEERGTVHGAGDPFVLKSEIEQTLMAMRTDGLPNRMLHEGWHVPTLTLNDTGRVDGTLMVETQPKFTGHGHQDGAKEMARNIRRPLPLVAIAPLSFFPPFTAALGLGAIATLLATSFSGRSLKQATELTRRYQWTSTILYVELEGSVGKSQITAGRGRDDSFESQNVVLRSDCQIRIHAATFTTENLAVDAPRFIMGMKKDATSRRAAELAIQAVRSFEKSGVKIRSISMQDEAINTTARANLAMTAERQRALNSAQGPDALPSADLVDAANRLAGPGVESMNEGVEPSAEPARLQESNFGQETPVGEFGGSEVMAAPSRPIAKAPRSMRMRCPSCGSVNELKQGQSIECNACGLKKYA